MHNGCARLASVVSDTGGRAVAEQAGCRRAGRGSGRCVRGRGQPVPARAVPRPVGAVRWAVSA